jgi:Lon protease-like protein
MFPLGSVLFPAMPLALQVFEERYLKMMGTVLDAEESEFGVVLIERGSEVGGGDQRFDIGTTAQVLQVEAPDGPLQVVARGGRRFRVSQWIEEEPFPRAEVEFLDVFDPGDVPGEELVLTENVVRETLEYLATLDLSLPWPTDIELATDPVEKAWQLAGISPLGTLDHQDLLTLDSPGELLDQTRHVVSEALETFKNTAGFRARLELVLRA